MVAGSLMLLPMLSLSALVPYATRLAPHTPHVCRAAIAPRMCSSGWNADDEATLHDAIARASTTKLGEPERVLYGMSAAYVLIFNAGKPDEGVYTLQGRTHSTSSYVLAFERTDEADRFAQLLQAEGFDLATPSRWDTEHLSSFCKAGQFEVSLVPEGSLITPPTKNEYDTDAFDRLESGKGGGRGRERPDKYAKERAALERLFRQQ